jgi:hypothetical protein
MAIDRDHFTLVFQGDIGKFKASPMVVDTPYGRPIAAGRGCAFDEMEVLRDALERIQDALWPIDDAKHVDTVGKAREIALMALNQ